MATKKAATKARRNYKAEAAKARRLRDIGVDISKMSANAIAKATKPTKVERDR